MRQASLGALKVVSVVMCVLVIPALLWAQTAATGALAGTVSDPAGALVPEVEITVTNEATGEARTVHSRAAGTYRIVLLPPGSYRVEARKSGFKVANRAGVRVVVTETTTLNFSLEVGALTQTVTVEAGAVLAQTESSTLGRVVDEQLITNLPLNTRNFTQIVALSPGIIQSVPNAAELGRGSAGLLPQGPSTEGVIVHGARAIDNSFQMNGIDVNDWEAVGGESGAVPVPNPDTIQEFKVQTGLFDAGYGRNAGANVNIVTKSGGNDFHGSLFEFFRNENLNANDFFFNLVGEPKPVLRQNQFGGTIGGPIRKDKLFFFGSYQGTRQKNGASRGEEVSCATTIISPPLTDDRSAAALGALFGGRTGAFGGVAVAPDGSNIHPVALQILNLASPQGGFLLPSPQVIDSSLPFSSQGFSAFSIPCTFDDDQFMINMDFLQSEKSKLAGRFFYDDSDEFVPFPSSNVFHPRSTTNEFRTFSLSHSYVFSPSVFNEVQFGFHRNVQLRIPEPVFQWSDLGVAAIVAQGSAPSLDITGSYRITTSGAAPALGFTQSTFIIQDSLSYVRGSHSLRFGGGVTRRKNDFDPLTIDSRVTFLTFEDFLLGLDGPTNIAAGGILPNILFSLDFGGLPRREFRSWDGFFFAQDDYKLTPQFTLNLGVRYERIGTISDELGRRSNFDPALANPNPPATGTLEGFIVASNFPGTVPADVTQSSSKDVTNGEGQNAWAPRIGFAWQALPQSSRLVVRGGYGLFYSRPTGQQRILTVLQPPFGVIRVNVLDSAASWDSPFATPIPAEADFPQFTPYSPTTSLSSRTVAPDFQPGVVQQWSLNIQTELATDFLLEVGYVGTRGTKLSRARTLNQALLASPSNPIRGETTNTVANIVQRVPILGWSPTGITQTESGASSWYNGLEVSVTKRMSKGLQFLASYTWSKHLDTEGSDVNAAGAGAATGGTGAARGDNNDDNQRYGPASVDRTHRFVFSYVYDFPNPTDRTGWLNRLRSGWSVSGVTIFQSGQALTIVAINGLNVFGITNDRVQLAPGCTHDDLVNPGSVDSKLNNYFNTACFSGSVAAPIFPVIGDDGLATDFGNGGVGIARGPDQRNFDVGFAKRTSLTEAVNLEFRGEFFNIFNTPQFANPNTNFSSGAFGTISNTRVNPRIVQLALKINF